MIIRSMYCQATKATVLSSNVSQKTSPVTFESTDTAKLELITNVAGRQSKHPQMTHDVSIMSLSKTKFVLA